MEIVKTEIPLYEPGFNIENGEVFDRIGGNINIDIRPDRNGKRIPDHDPLFVPQKKNQQKYICPCDSVKGGTELTCLSGFLIHCKKRTHNTWLQQQEDRNKKAYNQVKDYFNKSFKEQKNDLNELIDYSNKLKETLNKVSQEMEYKDNKISELTKEKYKIEEKNIELKKKYDNSKLLIIKLKKAFKKEREKYDNLLLKMEIEQVDISDIELDLD